MDRQSQHRESSFVMEGIWLTKNMDCQRMLPRLKSSSSTALTSVGWMMSLPLKHLQNLSRSWGSILCRTTDLIGWGCLKYIPHRLAGVTLLTPASNYWWPGFPSNLSTEALYKQPPCDYWSLRVAHYAPWLTHWWNTQNWFPSLGATKPHVLSREEREVVAKLIAKGANHREHVRPQGEYESLHRDLNLGFGAWEFDPVEMENPFTGEEVYVHLWQGDEDTLVPATLQRYIADRHSSWIRYHELAGSGHLFPHVDGMADTIVKTMANGKQ
ncbi:unnamed protein product [Linum trigynum]|uniref:AB hydrolase-1 domain-containing protein n=1 Tax=Linum trigynum TaxID=586398 RepID=A0AAV2DYA4_9ROSI